MNRVWVYDELTIDGHTIQLNKMEALCLDALDATSSPDGDMYVPFKVIEKATGLSRPDVRRSVRSLARKGLAEFSSGLTKQDGKLAGSGYCITTAAHQYCIGRKKYKILELGRRCGKTE